MPGNYNFTDKAYRQGEITLALHDLAKDRQRARSPISRKKANDAAHVLILEYLREIVQAQPLADAFAGAVGIVEPIEQNGDADDRTDYQSADA